MAMVQRYTKSHREYQGPSVFGVGIREKYPKSTPTDQIIRNRQKEQEELEDVLAREKERRERDIRNDWERSTNLKIRNSEIRKRVNEKLALNESHLEERRDRLRNLLLSEEENLTQESLSRVETIVERQARMRNQARLLREQREMERKQIVNEKLDQKFKNECEELRTLLSQKALDEVAAERIRQMGEREKKEKASRAEDEVWSALWYADIRAKAAREEKEEEARASRHKDVQNMLRLQMAALEEKKKEEDKLKQEESELLVYQHTMRKLEEAVALENKRRKQLETQQMLDRSLRIKMKRKAKEVQEELAFDMQMLAKLLEETENEQKQQAQRKKELREESNKYMKYLEDLAREEKLRELELQKVVDTEVEKMWQKRLGQWRAEKEARARLLQEVLNGRKQQTEYKLNQIELIKAAAQREKEELLIQIEANKQIEAGERQAMIEKGLSYQNDLLGQMDYERRQRELENIEQEREEYIYKLSEKDYQDKMKACLQEASYDKVHPVRRREMQNVGSIGRTLGF